MLDIQRILCPVDFSEFSERAYGHAVAIARWYGSTISVLHVIDPAFDAPMFAPFGAPVATPALTTAAGEQIETRLRALVATVPSEGVSVDVVIREGRPDSEILRLSDSMPANLLVMGTHGRSGFDRLVMGSVTEKVLRKAFCPVLSVPSHMTGASRLHSLKRLLCPVDFSDSSMRALQCAVSLAEEADAHLTVLHVARALSSQETAVHPGLALPAAQTEYEHHLRRRLADFVPAAARAYCSVDERVTSGKAWREILRIAEDRHAELIVIGVRGRSSTDTMLFGSTTHHVVRQATCPVLSIRS